MATTLHSTRTFVDETRAKRYVTIPLNRVLLNESKTVSKEQINSRGIHNRDKKITV